MLKQFASQIPTSWRSVILSYIDNNLEIWNALELEIQNQKEKYKDQLEIYPKPENIFKCFHFFDAEETQVVILGQDPYHGPNQAIGISFGVNTDTKKPPSLKNIEKELISDIGKNITHHDLSNWCTQGVLMLNASLTVLQSSPSSHMKLWKHFTNYIIDYINKHNNKVAFIAWGRFAYNIMCNVDTEKHYLHVSSHPSPFSFSRTFSTFPSFKNSKPFSTVNNFIKNPIVW
jgi:uracil-DNA glycosylase